MSLCVSCNDIVADIAERIGFAEHGKLVAESSEFHLTLRRAHKAHFLSTRNTQKKKRDILSEKRESGIALKKRELTPESGTVDTYAIVFPKNREISRCCATWVLQLGSSAYFLKYSEKNMYKHKSTVFC